MEIKFYQTENGKEPVYEFINKLSTQERAILYAYLTSIETYGYEAPLINFRQIKGKLWEIKIKTRNSNYRIFYVVIKNNVMILLHAYKKKSQKAPKNEIEVAESRMKGVFDNEKTYYS